MSSPLSTRQSWARYSKRQYRDSSDTRYSIGTSYNCIEIQDITYLRYCPTLLPGMHISLIRDVNGVGIGQVYMHIKYMEGS